MASLTRKIIHGRPYYYLRETARVQGRSKVVRTTYLGRAEDIESRLVGVAEPKAVVVGSFGAVAAAWKVCEELQVAQAIDRALGARRGSGLSVGEMITLAAINRACAPRSKRQLGDWHARTALCRLMPAPRRSLSSQRFWDAMHVLSDEAVAAAETEIVRRAIERYQIELRPLIYDTTNFQTFIDSANARNTIARRGPALGVPAPGDRVASVGRVDERLKVGGVVDQRAQLDLIALDGAPDDLRLCGGDGLIREDVHRIPEALRAQRAPRSGHEPAERRASVPVAELALGARSTRAVDRRQRDHLTHREP